jgi:hypothetical protein
MRTSPPVAGMPASTAQAPRVGTRTQATVAGPRAERVAYLDRLKVVLVAMIIASHGALG